MKIKNISAQEILDSRGNPTVTCTVTLDNGIEAHASVPSGASVGTHEAVELRDGDLERYRGKGVLKAVYNIEKKLAMALIGQETDVLACDKIMIELDGSENKSLFGANSILPVSMAIARAQAIVEGLPLCCLLERLAGAEKSMPTCMFNILNGGVHSANNISFQEFMIMPTAEVYADRLHVAALIYHKLKEILEKQGCSTGVGDEGGFAPNLKGDGSCLGAEREALDLLLKATREAGFEPEKDVEFCLDVAASEFFDKDEHKYVLCGKKLSSDTLVSEYEKLINEYPIYSIEDGLSEDDWNGWKSMTKLCKIMLVGDDIFVSNPKRITQGMDEEVANSVLIKPNQIGTISETIDSITLCKKRGYKVVVSHRSGETCDSFIADLAYGVGAEYFKAGAPARGERVAKYNRLLSLATSSRPL